MSISKQELTQELEAVSQQDATPSPEFVARLEMRMEQLPVRHVVESAAPKRAFIPHLSWIVAALLALIAGGVGAQQFSLTSWLHDLLPNSPPAITTTTTTTTTTTSPQAIQHVGADHTTTSSTSSVQSTTSTAQPTTSTTMQHSTVTTAATTSITKAPVATTSAPATTTTTAMQSFTLTCAPTTINGSAAAYCGWSASTSSSFHHYSLLRYDSSSSNPTTVYTTTNRNSTTTPDKTVTAGTNYRYVMVAYTSTNSVLGYSNEVTVTP